MNAALDGTASAEAVRTEIWRSLVSMLRVYAHAATLNSRNGDFEVTTFAESACVRHGGHRLELSFAPVSGAATWTLDAHSRDEVRGSFSIEEDGRLRFAGHHLTGETKELDEAAMDWVAMLGSAARSQNSAAKVREDRVE